MEPVRLGSVGLGWWGGNLARTARDSGSAQVVACFDLVPEARARFAEEHGCIAVDSLDGLLGNSEVEGILFATPHSTHLQMVEAAASAGKHVYIEKPLTLSVTDAKRAIEVTARAGVVLQVGHNRRRQPANRRIKQMLDAGELGTLLQLEGFHASPLGYKPDQPGWRKDREECPAGGMTGLAVHTVDTFHYLAGPAAKVVAFTKRIADVDPPDSPLDDATSVLIEYESGPLATIGTSVFVATNVALAAFGTEATAWNEEDGAKLYVQRRAEPVRGEVPVEGMDTVADELGEFARCIRTGDRPETGGPEGLEVAAVLEAIILSSESGRAVEVSSLR